ncbi:MAG: hypothetical protein K8R54_15985 [Bacteroidales bacterium]|nr:hypothetical protein [Bacteroidales bacterium]
MKLLKFYKSENQNCERIENLISSQAVLKEYELKQIIGGGGEEDNDEEDLLMDLE